MKKDIIENCPICFNASTVIAIVPTINANADDRVELRCCNRCGHWWHSPIPVQEELNKLYRCASSYVVSDDAKKYFQNKVTTDSFQDYVFKRADEKPGKYLEIGTGGGGLLRRFRAMNYTCYGVDPGQWVDDSSIVGSVDELPNDMRCDVLVLQDVLEHVFDPVGLLTQLKKYLCDGGVVFCSFPCNDSRQARFYKDKWPMVRPYGHLHYFSFASAKNMFSISGLSLNDIHLERITPIRNMMRSFNIRGLVYELLKGGKDQIYAQAFVS